MSNGSTQRRHRRKYQPRCARPATDPPPNPVGYPPPCPDCGGPQIVVECSCCGERGWQCSTAPLLPGVRRVVRDDFSDLITDPPVKRAGDGVPGGESPPPSPVQPLHGVTRS